MTMGGEKIPEEMQAANIGAMLDTAARVPGVRIHLSHVQGLTETVWQGGMAWGGHVGNFVVQCRSDPVEALAAAIRIAALRMQQAADLTATVSKVADDIEDLLAGPAPSDDIEDLLA